MGCRDVSEYGKYVSKNFGYNLAKNGFNIVSGLAVGVDVEAHYGAINFKGKAVAVLGSGIKNIYPKQNIALAKEIINSGGCIISEYENDVKANKMNFPQRNRIISGLSQGVVIIEAKEKSGALITAEFAIEQGREVFAVPGNITSNNSVGTNKLIKEGATSVLSYKDIINELHLI